MSKPARESSKLQLGKVEPITPDNLRDAIRFAVEVAERDGWALDEVLAMLGGEGE